MNMSSDEYLALLTDSWLQQKLQKWSLPCAVHPVIFKHFMHPSPINPEREEPDLHPQILLYPLIPASSHLLHLLLPSNHHLRCLTKYTNHGSHSAPGYSEIRADFCPRYALAAEGKSGAGTAAAGKPSTKAPSGQEWGQFPGQSGYLLVISREAQTTGRIMHVHKKKKKEVWVKPHSWISWTWLLRFTELQTKRRRNCFLKRCWNLPFQDPCPSLLISIYLASLNYHCLVPKQAGKLACHSYWGLKCSTKACFRHISGTSSVQGNRYNAKFSMLAGTPREELWLDDAGVSHTVNKQKKQGHSISQAK